MAKSGAMEYRHHNLVTTYPSAGTVDETGTTGAFPITHPYVRIDTTAGASAQSIADGEAGQVLVIDMETDGGDAVLTPATATGWSVITFADAGDKATIMFVDSTVGWIIIGSCDAAGTGGPAFTAA